MDDNESAGVLVAAMGKISGEPGQQSSDSSSDQLVAERMVVNDAHISLNKSEDIKENTDRNTHSEKFTEDWDIRVSEEFEGHFIIGYN